MLEEIQILIEKYIDGTISVCEMRHLDEWYQSFDSRPDLYLHITDKSKRAAAKAFNELKLKLGIA